MDFGRPNAENGQKMANDLLALNFEDPLGRFCKQRIRDGSYGLSKLEIPCARYRLVLFLRHGRIFLKNHPREL